MRRPSFLLIALSLSLPGRINAQAGKVERTTRGDTTIVKTTGNGVWGVPRAAVELLRVGDKEPGLTFGYINAVAALPNGGVAIHDLKATEGQIARILTPTGAVLKTFGRAGKGPGEVTLCNPNCMIPLSDGSIVLHDVMGARVTAFTGTGNVRSTTVVKGGFGILPQFLLGPSESYFLKIELQPFNRTPHSDADDDKRFGYLRQSVAGVVLDTIRPPASWLAVEANGIGPRTYWRPLPDGRVIVGGTDKLAFLVRSALGAGPKTLIEGPTQLAAFLPEERTEREAGIAYTNKEFRNGGSQLPLPTKLPPTKPAYKSMQVDVDGRVWLERYVTAEKSTPDPVDRSVVMHEDGTPVPPRPVTYYKEPPTFAAFKLDGTYLGEVRFPIGATKISFAGNFAWAVIIDADEQQILVKYRLPG